MAHAFCGNDGKKTALFAVRTRCRAQEVCGLEWEVDFPELDTSMFIVPGGKVKNGEDRLVVLNRVALSVVDEMRKRHPVYVFPDRGRHVTRMNISAWVNAGDEPDCCTFAFMI